MKDTETTPPEGPLDDNDDAYEEYSEDSDESDEDNYYWEDGKILSAIRNKS